MSNFYRLKFFRLSQAGRGYTLLEMVVAIGILGVLAVSATALFFSSIRGGGKVDVATEVKQNGQFALNTMEILTRNALRVDACTPPPDSQVVLVSRDGQAITFACVDVDDGDDNTGHIASNSARLTSPNVIVSVCSFSCDEDPLRGTLVTINFSVHQAGSSGDVSGAATADFSTSVSLRSY